jgi:hypothetical protein
VAGADGGFVGLLVSSVVLALIWFGVGGVLNVGGTDLMSVFWPSSVMLVVGWRSTIPGVMITASSVVINCLLFMAIAYAMLLVARSSADFCPKPMSERRCLTSYRFLGAVSNPSPLLFLLQGLL